MATHLLAVADRRKVDWSLKPEYSVNNKEFIIFPPVNSLTFTGRSINCSVYKWRLWENRNAIYL
jgi:hypothetical protein